MLKSSLRSSLLTLVVVAVSHAAAVDYTFSTTRIINKFIADSGINPSMGLCTGGFTSDASSGCGIYGLSVVADIGGTPVTIIGGQEQNVGAPDLGWEVLADRDYFSPDQHPSDPRPGTYTWLDTPGDNAVNFLTRIATVTGQFTDLKPTTADSQNGFKYLSNEVLRLSLDDSTPGLTKFTPVNWHFWVGVVIFEANGAQGALAKTGTVDFVLTQNAVPEPATFALLGASLIGLGFARFRQTR